MRIRLSALLLLLAAPGQALAQDAASTASAADAPIVLTLRGHRFQPDTIEAAAGQIIEIDLRNEDPASEEFDSDDLGKEVDVTPKGRVRFRIGPLKPGVYTFMGELHPETAQGRVVVADPAAPAAGRTGAAR